MTVHSTILDTVGNTPLVRLNRITEGLGRDIYVKVEGLNPSGSIKIRTALSMIEDAERREILKPDSNIIEFSSGNQGIGLSLVAAVKGYKCTIVMPEIMSDERKKTMRAFGTELILNKKKKNIGETFAKAEAKVKELLESDSRYFLAGQFVNPANTIAHYQGTGSEIVEQLGDIIPTAFVSGFGTGGTITGISRRLKEAYPKIKICIAEPDEANILAGCEDIGCHGQQGIGDGFIPELLDTECHNCLISISDDEAYDMARKLASLEGLFCGISSGTNVSAAVRYARQLPEGSVVITILPDLGERYVSVQNLYH